MIALLVPLVTTVSGPQGWGAGQEYVAMLQETKAQMKVRLGLSLERGKFDKIEIVDVLVGEASLVVFLRAGETELSCLIEIDDQARFRRLIASLSEMTQV